MMRCGFRNAGRLVCLLVVATTLIAVGYPAYADLKPSSCVAVWVTQASNVEGVGSLEEFLVDRLGSSGLYSVCDPGRVRAAGSFVGLGAGAHFEKKRLAALGRALGCRWVVWVKVVDRGVDFKKGLSVPHLFIRRKAVSRMMVDARVVDAAGDELIASRRWRLDKSGAGSYQVVEDVRQDPVYNNSTSQFYQDARRLEWKAARGISCWFKTLVPLVKRNPAVVTREQSLGSGPFVAEDETEFK